MSQVVHSSIRLHFNRKLQRYLRYQSQKLPAGGDLNLPKGAHAHVDSAGVVNKRRRHAETSDP